MKFQRNQSKETFVWVCVGVTFVFIIVFWIWTARYRFQDAPIQKDTMFEEIQSEVYSMFNETGAIIKNHELLKRENETN